MPPPPSAHNPAAAPPQALPPLRVLLINYDFPPGLAGVRRMVKLARYLPDNGIQVVVLAATPDKRRPLDVEGLREVQAGAYPVFRTPAADAYHLPFQKRAALAATAAASVTDARPASSAGWLGRAARAANRLVRRSLAPDDRIGWYPFALREARRLMRTHSIDCIVTSSFPHTTHLVGRTLQREFGVPWLADFRDGWTQNPYFHEQWLPLRRWSAALERAVCESADEIVTVSAPIAHHLNSLRPARQPRVQVVPNGFDPTDFERLAPRSFEYFTIVYTGTFMGARTPAPLFAALAQLFARFPGLRTELRCLFKSNWLPEYWQQAEAAGVADCVTVEPLGSYRSTLELQAGADCLLVIEPVAPGSEIMLTQKVFEYLAARKPILALCGPGALGRLVHRCRAGATHLPEDAVGIAQTLFEYFHGMDTPARDEAEIARYTRQAQAAEFARLIRRATGR